MARVLKMFSEGTHHPDSVTTPRNRWEIDKESYDYSEGYVKFSYIEPTVSRDAELCPCGVGV